MRSVIKEGTRLHLDLRINRINWFMSSAQMAFDRHWFMLRENIVSNIKQGQNFVSKFQKLCEGHQLKAPKRSSVHNYYINTRIHRLTWICISQWRHLTRPRLFLQLSQILELRKMIRGWFTCPPILARYIVLNRKMIHIFIDT